ncbi:hypothetical protein VTO73DRAFT_10905 [Trametes versicolor]
MAHLPSTEPGDSDRSLDQPDLSAPPRIILHTRPELSFSTPTHSIHVQLALESDSDARDEASGTAVVSRNHDASNAQQQTHPIDPNFLCAIPPLTEAEQLQKAERRRKRAAMKKLRAKVAKVETYVGGLATSFDQLMNMVQSILARLSTPLGPQDTAPAAPTSESPAPAPTSGSPAPTPAPAPVQVFLASITADLIKAGVCLQGMKVTIEETETALDEIEAVIEEIRVNGVEVEVVDVRGTRTSVLSIKARLGGLEGMIPLLVAASMGVVAPAAVA